MTINEFHITVNQQQLEVIAAGLQELPAKFANPVIRHINEQIQAQVTAAEQAAANVVAINSSPSPSRSDLGYERTSGPSSAIPVPERK